MKRFIIGATVGLLLAGASAQALDLLLRSEKGSALTQGEFDQNYTDIETAVNDGEISCIAALTSGADKGIYYTGSGTCALFDLTSTARGLLDDSSSTDMRTTLGLGSIATQASSNVTITGGAISGITDLAVADGGTGSSTAGGARTNLGFANRVIATLDCVPSTTSGAAPSTRLGGSTPVEASFQGYAFDSTADEYIDCAARLPDWFVASGGFVLKIATVSSATSGNYIFQAAPRRLDTGEDLDASHSYSAQSSGAVATSGTAGAPTYTSISFTSGQIDSAVGGELINIRINRDADNGSDTVNANDVIALLPSLVLVEP